MKIQLTLGIATFAWLLFGVSPSSPAQSAQTESNEWQFVAPVFYYWFFQTDGNITANGATHNTDLSLGGVMDDLKQNIQVYLELDKGNWGACVEPTLLEFSGNSKEGGFKFKNSVDISLVDFVGQYRVWHWKDQRSMSLYALAGVRYWNYDIEENGQGVGAPDRNAHLDIIDPIVGSRFRMDATKNLHLDVGCDVGGFGLTEKQSHFTWQTWLLLNHDITKRFSLFGGYRALGLDYNENHGSQNKGVDVVLSGPVIGFNYDIFDWLAALRK